MKLKVLLTCLECLSFVLWIVFTMLSIALAGLGLEGILFAAFMLIVSSAEPIPFPWAMTFAGVLGVSFSILWRQIGIDHFHYLQYDSPIFMASDEGSPSGVLHGLIQEVEGTFGYARNDARAKAKLWLLGHVSDLDQEDILLAKAHFGYLLPQGWGA